ncbi:hypothetical protein MRS76_08885 [Rhizobiaceae bacterium n13]|uniref:Uncharacterized protein n=1 Tax=Ferirhizobium litorale TaxID=2927786 RepID=A0AAE3QEV8_9HYPH|nr:hypothetical protein [Fererhizobium litorale]MDI7862070.1 hypothetical protein [Fererhizobium litorale]MDI7922658.1 hypothetical protein [Fererhizobium litorale]
MDLIKLREHCERKMKEHEGHLQELQERDIRHFQQEGDGPLSDVTKKIRDEYHRHIDSYAAIIAQIDGLLGA